MNLSVILKDPFRFFFPLGVLTGVLGVGLWLPLAWGDVSSYPIRAHQLIMVGGFLLTFVVGFLTTAVPRFTSTKFLREWEFSLLVPGLLAALYYGFIAHVPGHFGAVVFTLSVLIVFVLRRFRNRDENPPYTFLFVGAGLGLWWAGSLVLSLAPIVHFVSEVVPPARAIYNHGALLCLVIGVGGRLVPGMLGWRKRVKQQRDRYENAGSLREAVPAAVWGAVVVFVVSYLLEGRLDSRVLWSIRAAVMVYVGMGYWNLHRFPRERTGFTWGIWVAGWSFVIGLWVPVLWPGGGVHGFHTIFIGGFSLLTILVATRVTLAHGTEGKELESSSWILKFLIGLFVLAMMTRVSAAIWPGAYLSHLGYAALAWIVGVVLWGLILLPRMVTDFEEPA